MSVGIFISMCGVRCVYVQVVLIVYECVYEYMWSVCKMCVCECVYLCMSVVVFISVFERCHVGVCLFMGVTTSVMTYV